MSNIQPGELQQSIRKILVECKYKFPLQKNDTAIWLVDADKAVPKICALLEIAGEGEKPQDLRYKWSKIFAAKRYADKDVVLSAVEQQELLDELSALNQYIIIKKEK